MPPLRKKLLLILVGLLLVLGARIFVFLNTLRVQPVDSLTTIPVFSASEDRWLNSRPLGQSEFAGRVILLFFWTFD